MVEYGALYHHKTDAWRKRYAYITLSDRKCAEEQFLTLPRRDPRYYGDFVPELLLVLIGRRPANGGIEKDG